MPPAAWRPLLAVGGALAVLLAAGVVIFTGLIGGSSVAVAPNS